MDEEMMKALDADGEKLRQLTGEDHGPVFVDPNPRCECGRLFEICDYPKCPHGA